VEKNFFGDKPPTPKIYIPSAATELIAALVNQKKLCVLPVTSVPASPGTIMFQLVVLLVVLANTVTKDLINASHARQAISATVML